MQQSQETTPSSNREWKSSAFTTYVGTPERAAELFRALNHESEEIRPEDIEFKTLEGVLFMTRKNDMAFTVGGKVLVISEHQSTVNLNMPLRNIIYYGRTIEKLIPPLDIYRRKRIMIPTPEFYVFYNGTYPQPLEETLLISDSYLEKTDAPMLQLKTKVININLPAGHEILQKSRSMYEYSWFVQKIRDYLEAGIDRDKSISRAIQDCTREGIMVDFINEYGSEVNNMLFTQFNLEDARKVWREEDYEDGREAGEHIKLIQQVTKKLRKGKAPQTIAEELEEELSVIQPICDAAKECSFDSDQIYNYLYHA